MPTSLHHVCTICLVHAPQHVARWWGRASATESAHAHGRPYACITQHVYQGVGSVCRDRRVGFLWHKSGFSFENLKPTFSRHTYLALPHRYVQCSCTGCSSGTQDTPHTTRLFPIWHKAYDIDMAAKKVVLAHTNWKLHTCTTSGSTS